MKLYVAGNVRQAESDKIDYDNGTRNRLLSYAFIEDWADLAFKFWVENNPASASVFLDSGAYSAKTRGTAIDLDKYCDYIHEHKDALAAYAVLDVIGDWKATAVNQARMEARGLSPVPCFHRGEPWGVLDEMASRGGYVAIGGLVTAGQFSQDALQPYLDQLFDRLAKHWPVRVHLFGMSSQWILERYPLYSADSASAIMGAGMGRVQRFVSGQMVSRGWVEDLAETWDGVVADGVGRVGENSDSAHAGRRRRNIEATLRLEQHGTDLWTRRGVTWEAGA